MTLDFETLFGKEYQDRITVLDPRLSVSDFVHLDLSVTNTALQQVDISSHGSLRSFIWNHIKTNKAKVAYGGYIEKRGIYKRSDYFNQSDPETERNIHLGLDLWLDEGSSIFAPMDGTIHSFKNNTNYGDYGPTIILKHQINGFVFFTLYGHLSLLSLENKTIGQVVSKGDVIGTLGDVEVNGEYPPHLHFQIIKDIKDYIGDYPGVCCKKDLHYFKQNCPDPNLLLKLC